jgi:hypothetical protein
MCRKDERGFHTRRDCVSIPSREEQEGGFASIDRVGHTVVLVLSFVVVRQETTAEEKSGEIRLKRVGETANRSASVRRCFSFVSTAAAAHVMEPPQCVSVSLLSSYQP